MADIITYPENGITYDADDASGYLSTRLSGVYSADEDFAVTANSDLTVTVSAGQAWVRPARFRGRSIIMEQPETVTLTAADAVRSRIDRLVLRYDAAARKTSLTVLTGTPDSASPTAPEITRTALVYDLCLAEIRRPAGSTEVTSADITDTRTDEAVCGLMRDGVTGIPTETLLAQYTAILTAMQQSGNAQLQQLAESIKAVDSGSFYTKEQADAKFGTPYSLPPATADQLGGVKVGEALDIAPDGTLSAKTLNDKIAAAVAVKSEPRLVWNYHTKSPTKWKTYDVSIPDGVDYVHIKTKCDTYTGAEFDLVRGGNTSHVFDTTPAEVVCTMTFQADGTLHVQGPYSGMSYSYAIELWLSGYHYPTLADLLTQVTAVESSVTDLQVALCELYEEKEEN